MINIPPGAPIAPGAPTDSGIFSPADLALYQDLMARPSLPLNAGSAGGSRTLFGRRCILSGYAIRENGAVTSAVTYVTTTATGAASGVAPALPAGAAGITTWCTGFEVTGGGATAAGLIVVTVTGLIGGTLSYEIAVPAGVTLGITPLVVEFAAPGIPAAVAAQAVTLNVPSFGAGNTASQAVIHGYQTAGAAAGVVTPNPIAASFNLRNGPDAAAEIVASQDLSTGGVVTAQSGRDGPVCRSGIALEVLSGSFAGAIWIKA